MRKLLVALILLLGILFILARMAELQEILKVLQRGNLFFLGLALLLEIVWLYNLSAFYQSLYSVLGMEEKRSELLKLVMAANFLTIVAPSAGLSAIAVFVADARRHGRSTAKATVVCVLYVWFEYIGTLSTLAVGLAVLARRGNLHWPELAAASILLGGALGISLALYLGMRSAATLGALLARLARLLNAILHPITHRAAFQTEQAHSFAAELAEGIAALRGNPRWVIKPLLYSLLNKALLWSVLLFCFLAFKVPVDAGTIVAGLSIAHLFLIVSPTPAGVGIVEGILPFALNQLAVPLGDATVITLAYRGLTFWLPFMIGIPAIRLVSRAGMAPVQKTVPGADRKMLRSSRAVARAAKSEEKVAG